MYAGYVEDDAKVAARWAKRCEQAEEIIKAKEAENKSDAIRRAAAAEG